MKTNLVTHAVSLIPTATGLPLFNSTRTEQIIPFRWLAVLLSWAPPLIIGGVIVYSEVEE